jgi:hypothetical protein
MRVLYVLNLQTWQAEHDFGRDLHFRIYRPNGPQNRTAII